MWRATECCAVLGATMREAGQRGVVSCTAEEYYHAGSECVVVWHSRGVLNVLAMVMWR